MSSRARVLLADEEHQIFVSAVVAWQLATKARLGQWPDALVLATEIVSVIEKNDFTPLPPVATTAHKMERGDGRAAAR